jgi:hypothetical protein
MARTNSLICVVLIMCLFPVQLILSEPISSQDTSHAFSNLENCECHVIKGVPYVGQDAIIYCEYASVETVLKYYGLNTTQTEILYFIGGGYSFGYKPRFLRTITVPLIRPPYKFRFWANEITGGTDDYEIMANLLGLSFDYIYPKTVTNHNRCWREYWGQVKNYVKNDIPVITGVASLAWPPYKEIINLSVNLPKIFSYILPSTHMVVVVGFNETNKTVCVNDPGTGYFNKSEQGTYRWVNLSDFRTAVDRINWELKEDRYQMLIFKKISDPSPKNIIYDFVNKRNIKKMKGINSAYDQDFINKDFSEFGINGLKALKEDLRSKFLFRIPAFKLIAKFYPLSYPFYDVLTEMHSRFYWGYFDKHLISQYLLNNSDGALYHEKNAILLELESKYWKNLSTFAVNLEEVVVNNSFPKALRLTKPILTKMIETIDDIIRIEEMIIDDSSD